MYWLAIDGRVERTFSHSFDGGLQELLACIFWYEDISGVPLRGNEMVISTATNPYCPTRRADRG